MSRLPTEAEFNGWLADPVTAYVRTMLHAKREELRQQWEGGSFTDYEKDTTVLVNVGNLGTCKGYAFVTDLTYEQLLTEVDDDGKQVGPQALGSRSAD